MANSPMAKKPAKTRQQPSVPSEPPRDSSSLRMFIVVGTIAVLGLVGAYQWRQRMTDTAVVEQPVTSGTAASGNQTVQPAKGPLQLPAATPEPDAVPASAKFGPHEQASYPPLPETGFPPPRPMDTVAAVYKFAAEHPEVLGYIPCYCGCDRQGHKGNDDCFVAERNANGDAAAWDSHGMT